MKKTILLLLLSASSYSQIVVGEYEIFDQSPDKNKPEQIDLLKQKKTLFILPETFSIEDYSKVIADVWDISPFEVVWSTTLSEMPDEKRIKKYDRDYNFFKLTSLKYTRTTKSGATVDYLFNTMDLRVYKFKKTNKKGNDIFDENKIATIFLAPSIQQRHDNRFANKINPSLFLNFDLGYLKAYLKVINKSLKANTYLNCYDDYFDKTAIKSLKTHKLYIPDWVSDKYNAFSRTEGEQREDEELMKDYKFPYEIISDEKLNMMLSNNEDVYFLSYVQVNGNKLISVIDSKSGDIIYNSKTGLSYNVKDKDFKAISKKIED